MHITVAESLTAAFVCFETEKQKSDTCWISDAAGFIVLYHSEQSTFFNNRF